MCEPNDDWPCKFDDSPEAGRSNIDFPREDCGTAEASCHGENEFSFSSEGLADDEEEVTESKIRAFLDEKVKMFLVKCLSFSMNYLNDSGFDFALFTIFRITQAFDLKKLQEEFYSTLNVASSKAFGVIESDAVSNLSSKSKSPAPVPSRRLSTTADVSKNASPVPELDGPGEQPLKELPEIRELQNEGSSSRLVYGICFLFFSIFLNSFDS